MNFVFKFKSRLLKCRILFTEEKKLLHGYKFSEDSENSADLLYLLGGIPRNNYILVIRTFMQFCQRYRTGMQLEESHCLEVNM